MSQSSPKKMSTKTSPIKSSSTKSTTKPISIKSSSTKSSSTKSLPAKSLSTKKQNPKKRKQKQKRHNPKGRYIIHSNHKSIIEEQDVMDYISFDPGEKNFTIRLERRVRGKDKYCKEILTLEQAKIPISFQREIVGKGTKCFSTKQIIEALDKYEEYYADMSVALIEGQMAINYNMMHLQGVLISYFLLKYPHIMVVEISSKLKGIKLGSPDLARHYLKKWSIDTAEQLAILRKDKVFLDYIAKQKAGKKKSEYKIDDDTDNYIQIEAFCIEVGYQITEPVKKINTYKGPPRLVLTKDSDDNKKRRIINVKRMNTKRMNAKNKSVSIESESSDSKISCSGSEISCSGSEISYSDSEISCSGSEISYSGSEISYSESEISCSESEISD